MAETETLDRLYLEWSQFTGARTRRELEMQAKCDLYDAAIREIAALRARQAEAQRERDSSNESLFADRAARRVIGDRLTEAERERDAYKATCELLIQQHREERAALIAALAAKGIDVVIPAPDPDHVIAVWPESLDKGYLVNAKGEKCGLVD